MQIELSESEKSYLSALLRQAIKKADKGQRHLQNKHGHAYDPRAADASRGFRDRLLRKMVPEPAVSNVRRIA